MADILETYSSFMHENADHRVKNWFLMDSVWKVVAIQAAYIYFVLKLGPKLMENRKPFNIDKLLIIYNIVQTIANGYIFIQVARSMLRTFNLSCNPVDYSDNEDAVSLLSAVYIYFLTKIVDLLDTVFFVMRKKQNQITFLHVYHHCMMTLFTWLICKFMGGGQVMYAVLLNSLVHVVMYGYYLLSVWNKNALWWKKYITILQLVQFSCGFYVLIKPLTMSDCNTPKTPLVALLLQNTFFFALFANFYIKAYVFPKPSAKKTSKAK